MTALNRKFALRAAALLLVSWLLSACGGGSSGGAVTPPTDTVAISTGNLSGAVAGYTYSAQLSASGGAQPYGWSVASGALPAGMALSGAGVLSGQPTASGAASFTVKVTDAQGASATAALSFPVYAAPMQPKVAGNKIVDARTGQTWTPHGASWPSLASACVASGTGFPADASSTNTAASWGMDVMRLSLNQDCWLGTDGAPVNTGGYGFASAADYQARVQQWVNLAHASGMVVILELHWSAPAGTLAANGQYPMADGQSLDFWRSVAAAYKNDPAVMFEAFNEPYSPSDTYWSWGAGYTLTWGCWRDGGCTMPNMSDMGVGGSGTYVVTGMADLVAAIRSAGAKQPILLGGLTWANDLTQWLAYKPSGDTQLVAAWHNFKMQSYVVRSCSTPDCWNSQIAAVAAQAPVLMTAFGYESSDPGYMESAMNWADSAGIGYLPWSWITDTAGSDYTLYIDTPAPYTPTAEGNAYKTHLATLGR